MGASRLGLGWDCLGCEHEGAMDGVLAMDILLRVVLRAVLLWPLLWWQVCLRASLEPGSLACPLFAQKRFIHLSELIELLLRHYLKDTVLPLRSEIFSSSEVMELFLR